VEAWEAIRALLAKHRCRAAGAEGDGHYDAACQAIRRPARQKSDHDHRGQDGTLTPEVINVQLVHLVSVDCVDRVAAPGDQRPAAVIATSSGITRSAGTLWPQSATMQKRSASTGIAEFVPTESGIPVVAHYRVLMRGRECRGLGILVTPWRGWEAGCAHA
jgi:hypothetical protein